MSIEGPFTARQQECLARLRAMHRNELRNLFRSLKPPACSDLVGEYDAELLNQGNSVTSFFTRYAFNLYGHWIGKAFTPINSTEGIGYNYFRAGPNTVSKLPLRTRLGQSRVDDGESLFIRYNDLNKGIARWLVGELRQVDDSFILGFGTFGPKIGKGKGLCRQIPFVMLGPRREYRVDFMRVLVPELSCIA
jgi:hypothetical protein